MEHNGRGRGGGGSDETLTQLDPTTSTDEQATNVAGKDEEVRLFLDSIEEPRFVDHSRWCLNCRSRRCASKVKEDAEGRDFATFTSCEFDEAGVGCVGGRADRNAADGTIRE